MAILVFDDFNGANGTDIADHSPDIDVVGGGWSQVLPNEIELDGNGAVKFSAAGDPAWINTGKTDQIVRATINAGGADNRFQLAARSDNQEGTIGTNYSLNMRQGVSGSDNLFLFKRINGSAILLASVQVSFNASQSNEFELSAIGSTIAAKVDGVEVISVTDSEITTGNYAGFYHALYTNSALRVLDFTVEDNVVETPVTADTSFTINAPTFSSNASVTLPQPIADAAFTLSAPTFSASADASLPQPVASAAFTVSAPTFSASASATIPGFNASVSYTVNAPIFAASATVTLPSPTVDVSYTIASPTFSVDSTVTLPQPTANAAFSLPEPTFTASATATEPGFNASVNFALPAPIFNADATATLPQPIADGSFSISAPTFSVVAIVGGIAIIVDSETNINQRALSNNINAPILSNNIDG